MCLFRLIDAEKADRFRLGVVQDSWCLWKSGYYAWRDRPPSKRSREAPPLPRRSARSTSAAGQTYGYPRVHAQPRALGASCGRRRAARLMREPGLRGRMPGRIKPPSAGTFTLYPHRPHPPQLRCRGARQALGSGHEAWSIPTRAFSTATSSSTHVASGWWAGRWPLS